MIACIMIMFGFALCIVPGHWIESKGKHRVGYINEFGNWDFQVVTNATQLESIVATCLILTGGILMMAGIILLQR